MPNKYSEILFVCNTSAYNVTFSAVFCKQVVTNYKYLHFGYDEFVAGMDMKNTNQISAWENYCNKVVQTNDVLSIYYR